MAENGKKRNWFWRHKIMTVILAIIAIAVISSAAGGGNKTNSTNTKTASTPKTSTKAAVLPKIGEVARDGKFEFTVASVKCGQPSVSDTSGYVTKSAQGQYCLLALTVKNIGDKQQYFSESDQKLLNANKVEYSSDSTATLYLSNNSDSFLAQINPGNSVDGVLVYDIPKDQTPVTAELHDSAFSSGVKVNLQ